MSNEFWGVGGGVGYSMFILFVIGVFSLGFEVMVSLFVDIISELGRWRIGVLRYDEVGARFCFFGIKRRVFFERKV